MRYFKAPYPTGEGRSTRTFSKMYDWSEHLICGHARKHRDERKPDLSPSKRRPNRHHGSVKNGCSAYIKLKKLVNEDKVRIEYAWEHNGHDVSSVKGMAGSMLPRAVKEWIETRVDEGLDWRSIKPLLRLDAEMLTRVSTQYFGLIGTNL